MCLSLCKALFYAVESFESAVVCWVQSDFVSTSALHADLSEVFDQRKERRKEEGVRCTAFRSLLIPLFLKRGDDEIAASRRFLTRSSSSSVHPPPPPPFIILCVRQSITKNTTFYRLVNRSLHSGLSFSRCLSTSEYRPNYLYLSQVNKDLYSVLVSLYFLYFWWLNYIWKWKAFDSRYASILYGQLIISAICD